ncbi:PREDICTED: adenosine 3'-phospho 5'-phosphosulfate transporter 2 [Nicrophorus vespilloides]|uniref:Adenosine 3'-phospho 5'-phosphosulfate transporter 2 n=1 Tax=Nicrophorus vespilloides TaxID=110193 RepID=A0ABM1MEM1_NICVS|nr:PREDICTED: adenosine 3'-phospho 5'-phosphosulfate transporter 2 [Nicrophorus vespilloides]
MSVSIKIEDAQPSLPKVRLKIICFDITNYSQTKQFLICSTAVFIFFVLYGYMQELIFTIEGFKPYGWYLTLVQFGFYSIFGLIEKYATSISKRKIPIKTYILLAALTLGTMGFSNSSVGYLNYPTQVIFKCCKLLPVMAGSILIQGKRYGPLDFISASLMCVGLILFTLADSKISPNFNTSGVIMISLALLCDAVIGNVQEKSMKKSGASNAEVVLYSYSIGFAYLFIIMVISGSFTDGITFFAQNPKQTYGYAFIFSLTGYLGIQIVLTLVRTCGAFVTVTVTTCRKAMTIIISFIFFNKPFVFQYLTSGLLVVIAIYLNLYSKKNPMSFDDLFYKIIYLKRYIPLGHTRKQERFHKLSVSNY